VDLEACCPPIPGLNPSRWSDAATAPRTSWRAAGAVIDYLRDALSWALVAVVLTAFSVQAIDFDRILKSAQKYGPTAVTNVKALQIVMAGVAGKDDSTKLRAVNDFYNQRLAYMEDIDNWGVQDYWASPLEGLGKGAGDCPLSQTSCRFSNFPRSATHESKRTFHRVPRTSPEQGQAAWRA
jgi:hypothetical protein